MNIFLIIEILLWLALCLFLFIVLYDHYVDKEPLLVALSKRTKQVFFSTCLGKTIFFISRNQDSPNLYHGGSEFVNALSFMYLLNLNPEDIV